MARCYGWDTDYIYNVFGADEHLRVNLYKLSKSGKHWKPIASWTYSTFMASSIAHMRAERRIRKLRQTYNAEPI